MTGYKTWIPQEEVTAANMNSYVRDQTVNIYTNGAARAAAGGGTPARGAQSFLTDTMEYQVYYGATTGWRRPWTIAWGTVGQVFATGGLQEVKTSGWVDVTGATGAFNLLTNRLYRVTFSALLVNTYAGQNQWNFRAVNVTAGNTGLFETSGNTIAAAGHQAVATHSRVFAATATGATTIKLQIAVVQTTGTSGMNISASTAVPLEMTIEDIGSSTVAPAA
jgi:hypothetical protein